MNRLLKWLPTSVRNKRGLKSLISLSLAACVYFLLPQSCPEAARRTAFIFMLAALFWALEVIPLYATSLMTVILLTFSLARPGGVLDMDHNGYKMFFAPFASPIIILFLGGFLLASAMHKYRVDRAIASKLLKLFGKKPYFIMLGFMLTTALLSMWMSNTASTAMMIAMVTPLILALPESDRFRTGLTLSIAFGANIGGIGTPVGTPPNAIAIGILSSKGIHLNFLSWMSMAVPLAFVVLIITSFILYFMFPPKQKEMEFELQESAVLGKKGRFSIFVALGIILLWLTSGWHGIPDAIIALLGGGILTITGLLNQDDLRRINWDVLVLMWGGLALGKGIQVSGLADWIVQAPVFSQQGFLLIAIFCIAAVVFSTFISNTATANLIIPIAMSIPGTSQVTLAVTIALCCSFAMALPVSTPPNAIAFSTNTFRSQCMFKSGILVSTISVVFILLGYHLVISSVFSGM